MPVFHQVELKIDHSYIDHMMANLVYECDFVADNQHSNWCYRPKLNMGCQSLSLSYGSEHRCHLVDDEEVNDSGTEIVLWVILKMGMHQSLGCVFVKRGKNEGQAKNAGLHQYNTGPGGNINIEA